MAAALCDTGKMITPNQYYVNLLTTASVGLMLLMPDASTDKAEGKFETAVRATLPHTEEPHLVQAQETVLGSYNLMSQRDSKLTHKLPKTL